MTIPCTCTKYLVADVCSVSVENLTRELNEESGRVPPEARADIVLTQARLTRLTVPDEDPDRTLLLWLAKRGFHDVLALRVDAELQVSSTRRRSKESYCTEGILPLHFECQGDDVVFVMGR